MTDEANGNGRLSISEERVKNLLYEFKDDLLRDIREMLDKKADLVMLTDARKEIMLHNDRLKALEDWKIAEQASDTTLKDVSAKRVVLVLASVAAGATVLSGVVSSLLWIAFG